MSPDSELEQYLRMKGFDTRMLKEIGFARLYSADFRHGTDGHHRLLIIAALSDLVEQLSGTENGEENST